MPRDLFPSQSSPQEPVLTESPEIKTPSQHRADNADQDQDEDVQNAYTIFRDETDNMELQLSKKFRDADNLHPHVQTLSISDLEACVALENAAFPEDLRCSREKVLLA